jgi:hypothetical protein
MSVAPKIFRILFIILHPTNSVLALVRQVYTLGVKGQVWFAA